MPKIHATRLPNGALLEQYSASGAYTDCYSATLVGHISLADFMGVFYTTPIFKLERWILAKVLQLPSTDQRSEEHTSELQSLMRISYAVFCLNKKHNNRQT